MKLFHFTQSKHLPLIKKQGLKVFPIPDIAVTKHGKQFVRKGVALSWLTIQSNFDEQFWNLKSSKLDWRITIEPQNHSNIIEWRLIKYYNFFTDLTLKAQRIKGSIFWYVSDEPIPKDWITEIVKNPNR